MGVKFDTYVLSQTEQYHVIKSSKSSTITIGIGSITYSNLFLFLHIKFIKEFFEKE